MLGLTFAFARTLVMPDHTQYRYMPDVHRLTDVALDLRYEGRFAHPDAIALWVSGGIGPFLRIAEGSGTEVRARRIGLDVLRAEGGFDTRTKPLSIGVFAQVRVATAPECGKAFLFSGGSDVADANDFCTERHFPALWIGGGLRAAFSGD